MAGYFSYFPDIYVGTCTTSSTKQEYQKIKNIFRRVKAREDLSKYTEFFEQYSIADGELPFQIAKEVYGDDELDWVVLLTNNIVDPYEDWPRSRRELEQFANDKYQNKDGVHHYETVEIKYKEIVILEAGSVVDATFTFKDPNGITHSGSNARIPISNWEYEYFENEKKRQIYLAMPNTLDSFIEEFEELIGYEASSELDDDGVKRTDISISERFLGGNIGGGIGKQYTSNYTGTGRVATNLNVDGVAMSGTQAIATVTTTQADASEGQQAASSGDSASDSGSSSYSNTSGGSTSGSGGY